jgi:hypothetical protein
LRNQELYEVNDKFYFKEFQYNLIKIKNQEMKIKIKDKIEKLRSPIIVHSYDNRMTAIICKNENISMIPECQN